MTQGPVHVPEKLRGQELLSGSGPYADGALRHSPRLGARHPARVVCEALLHRPDGVSGGLLGPLV